MHNPVMPVYLMLIAILFFVLLCVADITLLTTYYSYQGYENNFSVDKFLVAIAGLLMVMGLIRRQGRNYTVIFYSYGIIFIALIPMLVHFSVTSGYQYFFISILASAIVILIVNWIALPTFYIVSLKDKFLMRLFALVVVAVVAYIFLAGGWRYFNLNIANVYLYRREAASNLPAWFGYIYSVVANILIPTMIVFALQNRSKWNVLIGVVGAILLFGFLAHKGILFNPLVTLVLFYFLSKRYAIEKFQLLLIAVVVVSLLDGIWLFVSPDSSLAGWISSLLTRRVLMTPPLLSDFYIEYFGDNPVYYWCATKITLGFLSCPYDITAPFVIGKEYFANEQMSANIGWIGAGYSNLKVLGVMAYSVLLGLIISLIAAFGNKIGHRLVIATSFLIVFNILTSTDIFTAFFSHGLFFLFLIYAFLPRVRDNEQ